MLARCSRNDVYKQSALQRSAILENNTTYELSKRQIEFFKTLKRFEIKNELLTLYW